MLTNRMLPRVDLPEVLLEVFFWTGADQAFTSVTGGEARLADLHISIAALLVSESCNIGWTPVIKHSVPALTRDRLAHVDATYLRMDTLKAANAVLIEHQARPAAGGPAGSEAVAHRHQGRLRAVQHYVP